MYKTARTRVGRHGSEGGLGDDHSGLVGERTGHIMGSEFWILGIMLTGHSLFCKLLDSSKCFKQWHYTSQLMFRK